MLDLQKKLQVWNWRVWTPHVHQQTGILLIFWKSNNKKIIKKWQQVECQNCVLTPFRSTPVQPWSVCPPHSCLTLLYASVVPHFRLSSFHNYSSFIPWFPFCSHSLRSMFPSFSVLDFDLIVTFRLRPGLPSNFIILCFSHHVTSLMFTSCLQLVVDVCTMHLPLHASCLTYLLFLVSLMSPYLELRVLLAFWLTDPTCFLIFSPSFLIHMLSLVYKYSSSVPRSLRLNITLLPLVPLLFVLAPHLLISRRACSARSVHCISDFSPPQLVSLTSDSDSGPSYPCRLGSLTDSCPFHLIPFRSPSDFILWPFPHVSISSSRCSSQRATAG